jgi:CheY-like chemotaxis protein
MNLSETAQLLAMPARPAILLVDDNEAARDRVSTYAERVGCVTRA